MRSPRPRIRALTLALIAAAHVRPVPDRSQMSRIVPPTLIASRTSASVMMPGCLPSSSIYTACQFK